MTSSGAVGAAVDLGVDETCGCDRAVAIRMITQRDPMIWSGQRGATGLEVVHFVLAGRLRNAVDAVLRHDRYLSSGLCLTVSGRQVVVNQRIVGVHPPPRAGPRPLRVDAAAEFRDHPRHVELEPSP